ncbi:zinc ribbon domain-containing protein [Adlercreutzia sp. ZJ141]|uniref:zinc ribbon domain-containing protein n=1 Tax=Adlercreutzia sp. ZJ141 TaxID=2709406 RepID=UPI0013EAA66F|nr:zinc ribbon domain-containing protein [Adlercreutzia sp. ZJ141]
MYCPFCGTALSDNAHFCRNCGKTMPQPNVNARMSASAKKSSQAASAGLSIQHLSAFELVSIAASPIVILIAIFAPWLNLTQAMSFAASWNGIGSSLTLIDETIALAQHAVDLSSYACVAGMLLLVAIMVASFIFLVRFAYAALARKANTALNGTIGFAGLAGVLLIHNLIVVFFPKSYVFGIGFSLGSPSAFTWVALVICAALAGCLVYDSKHEKHLFTR